ncbi:MAG: DUF748 domain-containing protein [Bacteroidales bacterium]|nr:DUF748 domain-containing protein [Bacteroidales bacterium]
MSGINSQKKKLFIRWFLLLAAIVLVGLFLNLMASRYVEQQIRNVITGEPHRGYRINYNSVHVNLLTFSLSFRDVTLVPEKNKRSEKGIRIEANIPVFRIRFIPLFSLLTGNKNIKIGEVLCKSARITVSGERINRKSTKDLSKQISRLRNFHMPLGDLQSLTLRVLDFKNLNFSWIDPAEKDTLVMGRDMNLRAEHLYLKRVKDKPERMHLMLNKLRLQIQNKKLFWQTGNYHLSFSGARFDAQSGRLYVQNIHFFPKKNRYLLARELKYRKGIYEISIPDMNVDFKQIDGQFPQPVVISQMYIDKPRVNIMVNTSLPIDQNKVKLMPNALLRNAGFKFSFDSLQFSNGKLVVEETNNRESVFLTFNQFNGRMLHITSVKSAMKKPLQMSINARLENEIPVHYDLKFPYSLYDQTFLINGYLGGGQLSLFNPVLISNAGLRFDSGKLESIVFEVRVHPSYVRGTMTMLYQNLTGSVLRKDRAKDNKLLSWVVNKVVKSDNPLSGDTVRVVPIFFERKPYHGLGVLLFRPLINGMAASTVSAIARSNQKSIDRLKK